MKMPGQRRKSTLISISKEIKLISTRLMHISLELDDYLYKQKHISAGSAEAYIVEIGAYKEKCHGDARSLQVIDKLIRCMKGIIEEQQEERHNEVQNDIHFEDFSKTRQVTASPVYSTADEDLTQLLEDMVELQDNLLAEKEIEVSEFITQDMNIDLSIDNENLHVNSQTIDIEMLGEDPVMEIRDEVDAQTEKQNNDRLLEPEFNIQKAISGLSINDLEANMDVTQFIQESQSILDNFGHAYNNLRKSDLPLTQEVLKPATFTKEPEIEINAMSKKATRDVGRKLKQKHTKALNINPKIFDLPKEAVNTKSLKPRNRKATAKNKTTEPFQIVKPRTKNNKSRAKATKTKSEKHVTTEIQQTQNEKIHGSTQKNNIQDNINTSYNTESCNVNQTQSNTIISDKNTRADNVPQIYNTQVVMDLSWMENILYVREICTEYESCTVEDGFWDRNTLAGNWTEDFK